MAVEARISSLWSKQKLFISLFMMLVAIPFWYDGTVGWPQSNTRWNAYQSFAEKGQSDGWPAYAQSHGWVVTPPHRFYDRGDIRGQYAISALTAIVGLLLFLYWFTQKSRRLRTDDEAVYTPSGTRVPFTSITGIGKRRWESKGLCTIRYDESGRQRQFILDDYKFEAERTHSILEEIERKVGA